MSDQIPEPDQTDAADTAQETPSPEAEEHTQTPHPPAEEDNQGDNPPLPHTWH